VEGSLPNRILREGIITSERVNSLTWAGEVFYRRLISIVDDYGRYYAKPELLRAACYPLQVDKVGNQDIVKWLAESQKAGLVRAYTLDEKEYLEVLDFRQQVRAKHSKFPSPDNHMLSTCVADAHLDGVEDEDDIGGKQPPQRFKKPSVDEVRDYCKERRNGISAPTFIDYYDANGWVQGKSRKPIKDWKATVRTWEKNQTNSDPAKGAI